MTTKVEMRQRVGEDLALVPIGQSLETQDQVRIDAAYDEVYERLKEKGLATWASTAEVPERLTPYYALMMQERLLVSYSISDTRYQRIKLDAGENGMKALKNLSELSLPVYEDTVENCDF